MLIGVCGSWDGLERILGLLPSNCIVGALAERGEENGIYCVKLMERGREGERE